MSLARGHVGHLIRRCYVEPEIEPCSKQTWKEGYFMKKKKSPFQVLLTSVCSPENFRASELSRSWWEGRSSMVITCPWPKLQIKTKLNWIQICFLTEWAGPSLALPERCLPSDPQGSDDLSEGGAVVKNLSDNAADRGSIPGSGRCPGEGNSNPLQNSCLENTMDRGA